MLEKDLNPSTPAPKKWTQSKPLKVTMAIIAVGVGTTIVPQKHIGATYLTAVIIGAATGSTLLYQIFDFDYNYAGDDPNAQLKGKIEGAIIGVFLATGMTAMRDDRLTKNQKLAIASGMGSVLGFNIVRSEFLGTYSECTNWAGAAIGAIGGVGILYGIDKIKMKKAA